MTYETATGETKTPSNVEILFVTDMDRYVSFDGYTVDRLDGSVRGPNGSVAGVMTRRLAACAEELRRAYLRGEVAAKYDMVMANNPNE